MEKIFSCNLNVNGENVEYHVVFDHEKYVFTADANNASISTFNLVLEEDEWKGDDHVDEATNEQAINALEKYLLSQH